MIGHKWPDFCGYGFRAVVRLLGFEILVRGRFLGDVIRESYYSTSFLNCGHFIIKCSRFLLLLVIIKGPFFLITLFNGKHYTPLLSI